MSSFSCVQTVEAFLSTDSETDRSNNAAMQASRTHGIHSHGSLTHQCTSNNSSSSPSLLPSQYVQLTHHRPAILDCSFCEDRGDRSRDAGTRPFLGRLEAQLWTWTWHGELLQRDDSSHWSESRSPSRCRPGHGALLETDLSAWLLTKSKTDTSLKGIR